MYTYLDIYINSQKTYSVQNVTYLGTLNKLWSYLLVILIVNVQLKKEHSYDNKSSNWVQSYS